MGDRSTLLNRSTLPFGEDSSLDEFTRLWQEPWLASSIMLTSVGWDSGSGLYSSSGPDVLDVRRKRLEVEGRVVVHAVLNFLVHPQ
jgi:hypothetical protein